MTGLFFIFLMLKNVLAVKHSDCKSCTMIDVPERPSRNVPDTPRLELFFDCSKLQFWNRDERISKKSCSDRRPIYNCNWDLNNNRYEEICWKFRIYLRKGERAVVARGLHKTKCPPDRYQPFRSDSTKVINCYYKKSKCTGEGQLEYAVNLPDQDRSCSCDYSKGYAFVAEPRNRCFCIPSEEDCSCYKKKCENETDILNPEFQCVENYNNSEFVSTVSCLPLKIYVSDEVKVKRNTADLKGLDSISNGGKLALIILCLILSYALLVILILFALPITIHRKKKKHKHYMEESDSAVIKFYIFGVSLIKNLRIVRKSVEGSRTNVTPGENSRYKMTITDTGWLSRTLSFQIDDVTGDDAGIYMCSVWNWICMSSSDNSYLSVTPREAAMRKEKIMKFSKSQIENHKNDATFYCTSAIKEACKRLDETCNILVLLGHKTCGKSKACNEIARHYDENAFSVIYFSINDNIENIKQFVEKDTKEFYVFDINMNPHLNDQKEEGLLETMTEMVDAMEKNVKCVFTATTTLKYRWLQNFPTKQQVRVDLFTTEDKQQILLNHMKAGNIDVCKTYYESNIDNPTILTDDTSRVLICRKVIEDIVNAETVVGFPKYCKTFCSNRSLLQLEDRYFKNPLRSVVKDINQYRLENEKPKLQYIALVYIMMNDRLDRKVDEQILENICQKLKTNTCQDYDLRDAAIALEDKYLIDKEGVYIFYNQMMKRAVWMSYIDIDYSYCIMNCPWEYVTDLLRPDKWPVKEKEVCIATDSSALCKRLVSEMTDVGKAWSVGTYLYKIFDNGKELLDEFLKACMNSSEIQYKRDILFSLFSGLSDSRTDARVFRMCRSSKDLINSPIDKATNTILHYCILHEYDFIFTEEYDKLFIGLQNGENMSPCDLAFYLGRTKIIEKYRKAIPEEYSFYEKWETLYSAGEINTGKAVLSKYLKTFGIDLLKNVGKNTKFGNKEEYKSLRVLLNDLNKTISFTIRIRGLPYKLGDEIIRKALEWNNCHVIKLKHEAFGLKNLPIENTTGDRIAICSLNWESLPGRVQIGEEQVAQETKIMLTIGNLSPSIADYQVENALSLRKHKVLEIFRSKALSKLGVTMYIAICEKTDPFELEPLQVEQLSANISANTIVLLKNLSKSMDDKDVLQFLSDKSFNIESIYREETSYDEAQQEILNNIPTGDVIAICKPLKEPLPTSIKIDKYDAEILTYT